MPGPSEEERILAAIGAGKTRPIYLVSGEPVLAEAAAERIAGALAKPHGVRVEGHRRPGDLGAILRPKLEASLTALERILADR